MSKIELGKKIEDRQPKRDAVHICILPALACSYDTLVAGTPVIISDKGVAFKCEDLTKAVGIVDPFLQTELNTGDCFWVFIYPKNITNVRHNWELSGVPKEDINRDEDPEDTDECKYCY